MVESIAAEGRKVRVHASQTVVFSYVPRHCLLLEGAEALRNAGDVKCYVTKQPVLYK